MLRTSEQPKRYYYTGSPFPSTSAPAQRPVLWLTPQPRGDSPPGRREEEAKPELSPDPSLDPPPHPRAADMAHFTAQKTEVEYECHLRMEGLALRQVREPCSPPGMAL